MTDLTEARLTESGGMRGLQAGANRVTEDYSAGVFTDPTSIPDCICWLDASDTASFTFSSGTTISHWHSLEGGNRDFEVTAGTPARSATVNGLPAVVMGGGTLRNWASTGAPWTPVTMAAVMASTPTGNWNTLVGGGQASIFRLGSTDNIAFGTDLGFSEIDDGGVPYDATMRVYTGTWTEATSVKRVNGVQVGTFDADSTPLTLLRIGDGSPPLTICEWAVYDRVLTTDELDALDGYLMDKWLAAIYSDDFNRANGSLGSPWVTIIGAPAIDTNAAIGVSALVDNGAMYDVAIADDQFSEVTMTSTDAGGNYGDGGPATRMSNAGGVYYYKCGLSLQGSSATLAVYKNNNGSYTQIGSTVAVALGTHTVKLTSIGSTHKAYVDGTEVISGTDTQLTSGRAGLVFFHDGGVTPARGDNWSGGAT
jgi:hypothetical protein